MAELCRIHANVFAAPDEAVTGPGVTLRGLSLPTLCATEGGPPPFAATMPVTFEEMQRQLLELPRSDCEPDGFFLLTGDLQRVPWKLNGHMHELGDRMQRVELNGNCPEASLDAVLKTMGWPTAPLVFELVQEGVTLAEPEFRAWARSGTGGP